MSVFTSFQSLAPTASLTASSDSSGGGATVIVIALIAIAAVLGVALVGHSNSTVQAVDKPAVSVGGFVLIALALGIVYFGYLGPAVGLT